MSQDLFGVQIVEVERAFDQTGKAKRKPTKANGYAARPGSGPEGETCKTCEHLRCVGGGSRFYSKCNLREGTWTHGPGSDIKQKSPACSKWEAEK